MLLGSPVAIVMTLTLGISEMKETPSVLVATILWFSTPRNTTATPLLEALVREHHASIATCPREPTWESIRGVIIHSEFLVLTYL